MKYDDTIDLAIGISAGSRIWRNKKYKWSKLLKELSEAQNTNKTLNEFLALSKGDQLKIKDVGGYVGGYLNNGRRGFNNIRHRQLITLDIDFANPDFWEDFCLQFNNAACLHSTYKHSQSSPRYRLLIPTKRKLTPEEYEPVSRMVAHIININLFDSTTFELNRLMFWPSKPKDKKYEFYSQEGEWIDPDYILSLYENWKDTTSWPVSDKEREKIHREYKTQEDPESKKGIIGAFCRTYSISGVIENILNDVYTPAGEDRYTYKEGTTAGGLVTYEDKFAYSHHGTDPCSGKLCNAFDLVRIHKFGHLDKDGDNTKKSKSFSAMENFILQDTEVKSTIAKEALDNAKYEFDEEEEPEDVEWMTELEIDTKKKYLSSAKNINLIFKKDPILQKAFRQNDFDNKKYVFKSMPWRKIKKPEPIKNVDLSGVRNYIESIYEICGSLKIEDAMTLQFEKFHYHPVKEYLSGLKWDQVERIDTLLINYFGCDDNIYIRESIRKALTGAVARVFNPGCKFDLVLTLVGKQGTGKSTFVNSLGKEWFSDTFLTVQGKDALEQLHGAWLIEMAELAGLKKAEVESIKHFISKQEDVFRPAYGRTIETFPRQCVFFATTNDKDFLRDPSGNRRFMPIDINPLNAKKDVFRELKQDVDQIWAEAVQLYRNKETLYLSKEAEIIAYREQKRHSSVDERSGLIEDYLNTKIPKNWEGMDLYERRQFLEDPLSAEGTEERDFVCVAEIWCECLKKDKKDMDRYKTREVNDIMKSLDDWEQGNSTKNFKIYGKQKYYARSLY